MNRLALLLCFFSLEGIMLLNGAAAQAKVVTKLIDYQDGGVQLQGLLAYNDEVKDKRPGVLVVHEWWGRNAFADGKARELAELGYVAFAADMYGKGVTADNPQDAGALASKLKNPAAMRTRAKAALDVLAAQPTVDSQRLASIGFCFGGTTSLQLAYSGAPNLKGVVSFHGGLATPAEAEVKQIKAKFLVLHGAEDPMVPAKDVAAFEESMRKTGADWQVTLYSDTQHAFTNPDADRHHLDGIKYNEVSARRSWRAMEDFLKEIFGRAAK